MLASLSYGVGSGISTKGINIFTKDRKYFNYRIVVSALAYDHCTVFNEKSKIFTATFSFGESILKPFPEEPRNASCQNK